MDLENIAPHAAGVCLAEIIDLTEVDDRPSDGSLYLRVKLQILNGSGKRLDELCIIKAPGGNSPEGSINAPSRAVVVPDSLEVGQRYWLAFGSSHLINGNPTGLLGAWPEDDRRIGKACAAAVAADYYEWQPEYHPPTDLSYGYLVNTRPPQLRIHVERDGTTLWEKVLPGERTERYLSWGLWQTSATEFQESTSLPSMMLVAETATALTKSNEYELPSSTYYVRNAYDPEDGNRLFSWVSVATTGQVDLVHREYDFQTGELRGERRFERFETGGLEVDAAEERWWRKVVRRFDANGRIEEESVYRYDESQAHEKWVKI